jgi:hypothetical protein
VVGGEVGGLGVKATWGAGGGYLRCLLVFTFCCEKMAGLKSPVCFYLDFSF